MKKNLFIALSFFFVTTVTAEESRNQYSNSIMFEEPESFNGSFENQVGKQLEFIFEKSNLPVSK